jgi:hypothetical protein
VGSLVTGLVLIPWIGTKGAQQVFIVVSAASGVVMMLLRRPAMVVISCARGRRIVFGL